MSVSLRESAEKSSGTIVDHTAARPLRFPLVHFTGEGTMLDWAFRL
jgi:hypothetical protein